MQMPPARSTNNADGMLHNALHQLLAVALHLCYHWAVEMGSRYAVIGNIGPWLGRGSHQLAAGGIALVLP